jgi:hypothetical protein
MKIKPSEKLLLFKKSGSLRSGAYTGLRGNYVEGGVCGSA